MKNNLDNYKTKNYINSDKDEDNFNRANRNRNMNKKNIHEDDSYDESVEYDAEKQEEVSVEEEFSPQKEFAKYTVKSAQKSFGESITSWINKATKCNFTFLKQYFDVTEEKVRSRILNSLIPFNPKFHDISKEKPDLYGPFWIFTTLVFIIAATGELNSYLHGDSSSYFEEFVPVSAVLIYGCGFGLPLILYILMKVFGSSPHFPTILSIYGYSFTSYIPICFICIIPSTKVHVISIGWGVFTSTSFILANCWKDASQYIQSRKYFLIVVILLCQIIIYFELVLYFFGLTDEVSLVKDTIEEIKHTVTNTTSTNSSSSN